MPASNQTKSTTTIKVFLEGEEIVTLIEKRENRQDKLTECDNATIAAQTKKADILAIGPRTDPEPSDVILR